jgi:hypothetical protein
MKLENASLAPINRFDHSVHAVHVNIVRSHPCIWFYARPTWVEAVII